MDLSHCKNHGITYISKIDPKRNSIEIEISAAEQTQLCVEEKTARRNAQMSKNPNQTEARRSVPTNINHHPKALIISVTRQTDDSRFSYLFIPYSVLTKLQAQSSPHRPKDFY